MAESPFTNREITAHFQEIKDILTRDREETAKVLTRIEAQTTRTNGRVTKLENWKSYVTGAIAIVLLFGGAFIGLLVYTYNIQLGQIRTEITNAK